jgi:hypothetical protein
MMNDLNSNLPAENALRIVSPPKENSGFETAKDLDAVEIGPEVLATEEVLCALEAVQRLNAKLEEENAMLREKVELLDRLVVKLLKRNGKAANKM